MTTLRDQLEADEAAAKVELEAIQKAKHRAAKEKTPKKGD